MNQAKSKISSETRSIKIQSNWLNYSLIFLACGFFVSGCNKNKYNSPFDELKTGKYEITMYKEYPGGTKDTLRFEAYGPRKFYSDFLDFDVISSSNHQASWGIYSAGKEMYYTSGTGTEDATYKTITIEHSNTELKVSFKPFIFPAPAQIDSAYGTVIFKYMKL